MSFASVLRCAVLAALAGIAVDGSLAVAAPTSSPSHPPTPRAPDAAGQRPTATLVPEPDPAARNVVARARMLECGHQWSTMKRAGTAAGTWKDFSRGCLAQR